MIQEQEAEMRAALVKAREVLRLVAANVSSLSRCPS